MSRREAASLLLALVVCLSGLFVLRQTTDTVPKANHQQMLEASRRTQEAYECIAQARMALGYPIDPALDPAKTGMIGLGFSDITTTLGALESKRSSVNPNVAAMVVELFTELELKPGDRVGVNLSGSFPGLNTAVLIAADTMGLETVTMSSVGASTYGANLPELTWPDMEQLLWENQLIPTRSQRLSFGGTKDLGLEFDEGVRGAIYQRLSGYGYTFLLFDDPAQAIQERIACYEDIAVFVNVGGNLASFGPDSAMDLAAGGILTALPKGERGNGLIQHYLRQGIPVVHLLNLKDLLPRYGLIYDPVTPQQPGEGAVFYTQVYSFWGKGFAALCFGGSLLCLYAGFRENKKKIH